MKKKLSCLAAMLMCMVLLCMPVFAAKPSVEVMYMVGYSTEDGQVHGRNPIICFRNNAQKPIKYLECYITAYNRVGDPVPDLFTGDATKKFTIVGPITLFLLKRENGGQLYVNNYLSESSPFYLYKNPIYGMELDGQFLPVYQDAYNHFFVCLDESNEHTYTYLTEDQIENELFADYSDFQGIEWRNHIIDHFYPDKLIVTYMDGSMETIANPIDNTPRNQELPFVQKTDLLKPVYNYADYLKYNPDLAGQFGTDQKCLFEHFVANGMAEGRRASIGFDLETYKTQNPDLVAQFGADNAKYYQHYIQNGQREGRIAA